MPDDRQRDEQIEAEGHVLKSGPERMSMGAERMSMGAERVNMGAERMSMGAERDEEPEVEGHVASPDEKRPPCRDDETEVEGHVMKMGAERAFGTEGAVEAEREPKAIRPDDGPEPADGYYKS